MGDATGILQFATGNLITWRSGSCFFGREGPVAEGQVFWEDAHTIGTS